MVQNENLCANQSLKINLMSFGTFFLLQKKTFFSFSFSKSQTPVAMEAPWKSRMVAVEGPCGSCGGAICPVYCPVGRNQSHLVSVHQSRGDWLLYTGQTMQNFFLTTCNIRGRRASTATKQALHGYRSGPPGLPVRGLHGYMGLTFGEETLEKSFLKIKDKNPSYGRHQLSRPMRLVEPIKI